MPKFFEDFLVAAIGWSLLFGAAYVVASFAMFEFVSVDPKLIRLGLGFMVIAGVWHAVKESRQ